MKILTVALFTYLFLLCGGLALCSRYRKSLIGLVALWCIVVGSALHVLGILYIPGFDYEIPPAALFAVAGTAGFKSAILWDRLYPIITGRRHKRRKTDIQLTRHRLSVE